MAIRPWKSLAVGFAAPFLLLAAPAPDPTPLHIADLDDELSGSGGGGRIAGLVGVWVHDAGHRPAAHVSVKAAWSGAVAGTTRCTTDEQGYCQMASRPFDNAQGITMTMTIKGFDSPEYTLDKAQSHDNDRDSDGTTIRIQR